MSDIIVANFHTSFNNKKNSAQIHRAIMRSNDNFEEREFFKSIFTSPLADSHLNPNTCKYIWRFIN